MSPSRRRGNPSHLDLSSVYSKPLAPNGFGHSPLQSPLTPRYSVPLSPMSPHRRSSEAMDKSARFSAEFTIQGDSGGGGLGNLADELADAWDEDGEGEEGEEDLSGFQERNDHVQIPDEEDASSRSRDTSESDSDAERLRDGESNRSSLQIPKQRSKTGQYQKHHRHEPSYDGSDYGNDSDFEEPGDLTPGLEKQMAGIENLVRWSMGDNLPSGKIVDRVVESLRDLGGQSGIENSATRCVHCTKYSPLLMRSVCGCYLLYTRFIANNSFKTDYCTRISCLASNVPDTCVTNPHSSTSLLAFSYLILRSN